MPKSGSITRVDVGLDPLRIRLVGRRVEEIVDWTEQE